MYDESMTYDVNGNIQSLQRNGDFDSNTLMPIEIDDLAYTYDTNIKNKLQSVTDGSLSPKGFKDVAGGTDYGYDNYGNMTSDANKGITSIVYNHLNLPTQINFGTGNKIEYLYDALGTKLRKKVWYGSEFITTDYLDGFQYVDEELVFFPHAEGFVNVMMCTDCQTPKYVFNYVFQYKDHLGNIRMNYGYDEMDETLKIMEENHYYPFGLKHTQYNSDGKKYEPSEENPEVMQIEDLPPGEQFLNKYKYEGREWQDELGLNVYPFKYRTYDPAIGRFWSIDPVAENYPYNGVYNFAENRVVESIDLEGKESWYTQDGKLATNAGPYTSTGRKQLGLYSPSEVQQMKANQSSYKGPMLSKDNLSSTQRKKQEALAKLPTAQPTEKGDGKTAKEKVGDLATNVADVSKTTGIAIQITATIVGVVAAVTGQEYIVPFAIEAFEGGVATQGVGEGAEAISKATKGDTQGAILDGAAIFAGSVLGGWINEIPGANEITIETAKKAAEATVDKTKQELEKNKQKE
jgi:RHS repeat-associated protein